MVVLFLFVVFGTKRYEDYMKYLKEAKVSWPRIVQLNKLGWPIGVQMSFELAAFAGTTCLGVGTWNETYDAYWLYITAPTDDEELVLRYYSAALKQIFVATTTLPYHNDTQVGTAAAPYTPKWIVTPDRE